MTVAAARKRRHPRGRVALREREVKAVASFVEVWRERSLQGLADSRRLRHGQLSVARTGRREAPARSGDRRLGPLLEDPAMRGRTVAAPRTGRRSKSSEFQATAIVAAGPPGLRPQSHGGRSTTRRSGGPPTGWRKAQPKTNEDRVFQILGLAWAGGHRTRSRRAARDLLAEQRADGGWGQHATLASDAYATGQALWRCTRPATCR